MKIIYVILALLFVQIARSQHIVHEIENDDFTGETIITIQEQREEGAFDRLISQSHLFSDFLNWRIQLKSITNSEGDRKMFIILWSPNDDTYGGLDDATIIFKFVDSSTLKTKVGYYDFDTDAIPIGDINYPVYTLWCIIPLSPYAFIDDDIDETGMLLNALAEKELEAVRMYFEEGYVNFEVRDSIIFHKLITRYNTLIP